MTRVQRRRRHTAAVDGGRSGRGVAASATRVALVRTTIAALLVATLTGGLIAGGVTADVLGDASVPEPVEATSTHDAVEAASTTATSGATDTPVAAGATDTTATGEAASTSGAVAAAGYQNQPLEAAFSVERSNPKVGQEVTFVASNSTGSVVEYRWNLSGAQFNHTADFTSHAFDRAGDHTVELTVVGENGATDTVTRTVTVEAAELQATFDVSDTEPVVGQPLAFSAYDSTGAIGDYQWSFGDGTERAAPFGSREEYSYDAPGEYTVTLTVVSEDGQRTNTTTETVTVAAQNDSSNVAAAIATNDTTPAVGDTVEFDASASTGVIDRYWWEFDDGWTSRTSSAVTEHTFENGGTHTVSLTAIGDDAIDNATVDIEVGNGTENDTETDLDAAFAADPATATVDEPVTFDASGSAGDVATYQWTLDDGATVNTSTPSLDYVYDAAGDYDVELTVVGESGETDTATLNVSVESSTDLAAGMSISSNAENGTKIGQTVFFDGRDSVGDVETYRWTFGNETTVEGETWDARHVYTTPGNHTVELTVVGADGATDTTTETVTIQPAELGASLEVFASEPYVGQPIWFTSYNATGAIESRSWDHGNGTTLATGDTWKLFSYGSAGNDTVELTVENGEGETDAATQNVTVVPQNESAAIDAQLDVSDDQPDVGEPVTFDAGSSEGAIDVGYWLFDDGEMRWGATDAVEYAFDDPGTYNVTYVATGADAADRAHVEVEVGDDSENGTQSDLEAGVSVFDTTENDTKVGQTLFFDGRDSVGDVETFQWTFGNETTVEGETWDARHAFTTPGNHTVELTVVGADGATDTTTETVTVQPAGLEAAAGVSDTEPFVGQPIWLTSYNATGAIESRSWDHGNGTTLATGDTWTLFSYDSPGNDTVELTVENDAGETDTDTQNVTVVPQNGSTPIDANLSVSDAQPDVGEPVTFDGNRLEGAVDVGYWLFDDGEMRWGAVGEVAYAFDEAGTYNVTYVAAGADAADRAHVEVEVGGDDDDADDGDDGDDDTGGIVISPSPDPGPTEGATFEIASVDVPTSVAPGATFDATVEIENSGGADGTATVEADLEDGSEASQERALDADASGQVELTLTAPESAGDHELTVATEDDERTLSLTVEDDSSDDSDEEEPSDEADDDGDSDDGGDGDSGDGDGTPGFGLAGALVALAVALLARGRAEP